MKSFTKFNAKINTYKVGKLLLLFSLVLIGVYFHIINDSRRNEIILISNIENHNFNYKPEFSYPSGKYSQNKLPKKCI